MIALRRAAFATLLTVAAVPSDPGALPGAPPGAEAGPIAVLPIENLSGAEAPIDALRAALRLELEERGFALVPDEPLAQFMRRQRMRYVGGLAGAMGSALADETGAVAVLVTSLDLYQAADPPKVAITARLVSTGEQPRILWMDGAALTGDQAPGFLGLGLVHDPAPIEADVIGRLAESLRAALPAAGGPEAPPWDAAAVPRRLRPKSLYRSKEPPATDGRAVRVAVLPFANDSAARNAGDLVALQIVRQARLAPGVEVIEPGVVREALLRAHLVQEEGLSLPQADLVRLLLDADLVIFGDVAVYVEAWAGAPESEVDFAARALSTRTRQIACASISHGRGDDGVYFFGLGRIPTAHELASGLSRGFIAGCLPAKGA